MMRRRQVEVRTASAEVFKHIYREHNVQADAAATRAVARQRPFLKVFRRQGLVHRCIRFQIAFDGGKRQRGAAAAWVLKGATTTSTSEAASDELEWVVLAEGSWGLGTVATAAAAETCAMTSAVLALEALRRDGQIVLYHSESVTGPFKPWRPHI